MGVDFDPEPGLADNGDLEHDLQALLEAAGTAAREAGSALVPFIDELQYVEEGQLAALITALHRTGQRRLPVVLVGRNSIYTHACRRLQRPAGSRSAPGACSRI